MPAQLVTLDNGVSIMLDKPILLVGRHPECDIQIDSRKISRRHCCIAQVSDYLVIRDLGSTNGIRINGVRVLEGRLNAGDEVTIGNNLYRVSWDSLVPGPPPVSALPVPEKARHPEPPRVAKGVPDDLLEECDEPVALAEPEDAIGSVRTPRAPALPLPAEPVSPAPVSGHILPDRLDLAPPSQFGPPNDSVHPAAP